MQAETAPRFEFGANWKRYLDGLSESRILAAQQSLQAMLKLDRLDGLTFVDLGCGSGIFSLAALRLGAAAIVSLDYDPLSVECARSLKDRFAPASNWRVARDDATDRTLPSRVGTFDVVYSWGVLHHTGAMWEAFDIACALVAPGGLLFVSIYNDQGFKSVLWRRVKRTYTRLPHTLQPPAAVVATVPLELPGLMRAAVRGRLGEYAQSWRRTARGMDHWRDIVDWVGGYPFEVARPEEVVDFSRARGLELTKLKTVGGALGCNEFVFRRPAPGT
jgi:SAM-dependent methyltransferase